MVSGVLSKVRSTVLRYNMISAGENVICGLSGGADSVCLLLVLRKLSGEIGFSLCAVHVNHCLRGAESDRDEAFCRELCEKLAIPFEAHRVDVNKRAAETGESTEEAARVLRYGVFEAAAEKLGGAKTATAHNLCDNSETMLFNAARGTGLRGLCGIPYVRGNIIRPIIEVSRKDIEAFLESEGQGYVTDSTNLSDDYSRNIIRHRVIPELERINPDLHESLLRLRESAAEDEACFQSTLEGVTDRNVHSFASPIRKRYIRSKLEETGIAVNAGRINILDAMFDESMGKVRKYNLSRDIYAVFRNGVMTVEKIEKKEKMDFSVTVNVAEEPVIEIPEFDKTVIIKRITDEKSLSENNVNKKLTNKLGNYVKIQGVVTLRNKRDGDRIRFAGRDHHTKLHKYFNEKHLTAAERESALVMEDENGLIWCEYGGFSESVAAESPDSGLFEVSVVTDTLKDGADNE